MCLTWGWWTLDNNNKSKTQEGFGILNRPILEEVDEEEFSEMIDDE
jgi:hypothetical protein